MATRWQERVRAAEQARFESSPVGRLMTALGISSLWLQRVRIAKRAVLWLAWAFMTRKLKLVAGGLAAIGLILVLSAVTALVLLIDQLA